MLAIDPQTALVLAHEHADHLCAEAAAGPRRRASGARRAVATFLRTAANRLDPSSPLLHGTA